MPKHQPLRLPPALLPAEGSARPQGGQHLAGARVEATHPQPLFQDIYPPFLLNNQARTHQRLGPLPLPPSYQSLAALRTAQH